MLGVLAWAFCFGFTSWKLRAQSWLHVEYADTLEEKLLGGEASEPASQDGF